jgi:hypothetical protein
MVSVCLSHLQGNGLLQAWLQGEVRDPTQLSLVPLAFQRMDGIEGEGILLPPGEANARDEAASASSACPQPMAYLGGQCGRKEAAVAANARGAPPHAGGRGAHVGGAAAAQVGGCHVGRCVLSLT